MAQQTIYLQIKRNAEVSDRLVKLKDVASVCCEKQKLEKDIQNLKLLEIKECKRVRICLSSLYVIRIIRETYPDYSIVNMGETDFIIDYINEKKKHAILSVLLTAFVSLFVFVGSAYGIMAYNNDVGTLEIFEKIYINFGLDEYERYHLIEIAYGIGLALGIIVFYNHFAGKRFNTEPTPVEVEMDKYEADVDSALIDRSEANGEKL